MIRILLWVAVGAVVLLLAGPWLIYEAGLSHFTELPQPQPAASLNPEQQQWLRCELAAKDAQDAFTLSPWSYLQMARKHPPEFSIGDRAAVVVARRYVGENLAGKPALARMLSEISLMIWMERHWTVPQVEARAHALLQHASHFRCPPGPAEWQP